MTAARTLLICLALSTELAACGSSSNNPAAIPSPSAAKPDVIVTFDGKRHACLVALPSEPQGSEVACKEIVPFVRDELRVPSGASYEVRIVADFDPSERASAESALKDAGYRYLGNPAVR